MSIFKRNQPATKARVIVVQATPWGTDLHGKAVSYSNLYTTSFAVRSVADFIARHVSRYQPRSYQVDSTGERPLTSDLVANLFRSPAPGISRHELMRHLALGVMISGNAYAPLLVDGDGRVRGITPTAAQVSLKREQGGPPQAYELFTGLVSPTKVKPEDMLHVRTWNPGDPFVGASPLDSLRSLLAEERAASSARERMWLRGLVKDGVIEVDELARDMSDEARESYMVDIEDALAGSKDIRPMLLLPGHRWKESAFSPKEAEFAEARNLTLRMVAGAYGLPPQLVGAEGRNIRTGWREIETALAPWANLIESAVNAQLVPRLYGEQAVNGRIRVRFESPAPITDNEIGLTLDSAVKSGRLTPDEARAVTGLPPADGGDKLYPPPGAVPAA
jgi:HK97 family phage portal protein